MLTPRSATIRSSMESYVESRLQWVDPRLRKQLYAKRPRSCLPIPCCYTKYSRYAYEAAKMQMSSISACLITACKPSFTVRRANTIFRQLIVHCRPRHRLRYRRRLSCDVVSRMHAPVCQRLITNLRPSKN